MVHFVRTRLTFLTIIFRHKNDKNLPSIQDSTEDEDDDTNTIPSAAVGNDNEREGATQSEALVVGAVVVGTLLLAVRRSSRPANSPDQ